MSELFPDDPAVDANYRRLTAADTSAPSEATRRAILEHARQLAAGRAAPAPRAQRHPGTRWGRPALFGTLAAALLAGLVIAPRYLMPNAHAPQDTVTSTQFDRAAPLAVAPPPAPLPGNAARADSERDVAHQATPPAAAADGTSATGKPTPPIVPPEERVVTRSAAAQAAKGLAETERQEIANLAARGGSPAAPTATGAAAAPETDSAVRLRHAAQVGDLAQLQALAREQPDLNARDALGRTALMLAILNGHTDAVAVLLASGADPRVADAQGVTPLQAARAARATAIVAALEHYGVQ